MALDEALAESVRAGALPVLRFYTWTPGALSLGRFQHPQTGLAPAAASVPRVRRLTGGGAIWHDDELTYSLSCTQDDLGSLGVKASFERLCTFLVQTWRHQGWEAGFAKDLRSDADPLGVYTPACFAGQEEYDILVGGKKLGGNAQRRDRRGIFQHGSLPRQLDWPTLEAVFQPGFRPSPDRVTDLRSCGWDEPVSALIPRLAASWERAMGVDLAESAPSAQEWDRAVDLAARRYGDRDWTETASGSLRAP